MPLYFGSDNKIYDSDLDGSTSYAGNTADYKQINQLFYNNLFKSYSKNKNVVSFDNSLTGKFSFKNKNYILSSKEEKSDFFKNTLNNYINRQITLLNYNPNTLETHLNSSNQGWTSDVIAIMKWKGNLENKRDQVVQDFVSGITDGLPLLEDFVKTDGATSFSSLRFYRGGNFSRFSPRTNREIELARAVVDNYDERCSDCSTLDLVVGFSQNNIANIGEINASYDYCIPEKYDFPSEFWTDKESLSSEEFTVKYFKGGTTENLGFPIFRMNEYNNGTTSGVYIAFTPEVVLNDQSILDQISNDPNITFLDQKPKPNYSAEPTISDGYYRETFDENSGNDDIGGIRPIKLPIDHFTDIDDFWEDVKIGNGVSKFSCPGITFSESDLYDPITNPCGVISFGCNCDFQADMKIRASQRKYKGETDLTNWDGPCSAPIPGLGQDIIDPQVDTYDRRGFGSIYDNWVSPNYSGKLSRCRDSGPTDGSGDRFWHGLPGALRCKNGSCNYEYNPQELSTSQKSVIFEYTITKCTSSPRPSIFDEAPDCNECPEYWEWQRRFHEWLEQNPNSIGDDGLVRETGETTCIDFYYSMSGVISSVCSFEKSCECGCNPADCICICAGNHENDPSFADYPTCTSGTCDYETRVIDVVYPPDFAAYQSGDDVLLP